MGKLKIGSCPRCHNGEVFIDRDLYGWYECCLQCGYSRDLPDIASTASVEQINAIKETVPALKGRSSSRRKRTSRRAE
jgi:uncharacterized protein (DUF983 family)